MTLLHLLAAAALAQELPTLSEFQASMKNLPAPTLVAAVGEPVTLQQAVAAQAQAAPQLPAKFEVDERVISWTTTFDIKDDKKTYGVVREKFISLTRSFTYEDDKGACVAKARQRILAWGSHVDVTDCKDQAIGSIKEQVLKSLFKVHTTYAILDAAGAEKATSTKVDWIGTDVKLSAGGKQVAKLSRPWINWFSDTWTVEVQDAAAVDSRLLVMIAAYKTSVDNARRREKAAEDDK